MKRIMVLFMALVCAVNIFPQNSIGYQSGIVGEKNLQAAANMSPYASGAVGFDNRYEGVKGTTRLFDTLLTSSLLLKNQTDYIMFKGDIDVVNNSLIFTKAGTGELMEISSGNVVEMRVNKDNKDLIYRTTGELTFEKEIGENKFYQVLKEGANMFICIPEKKFVEADYQRIYGPDRRYDEFRLTNKYYIQDSGNVFRRVQLNEKSLAKMFPDKKELIRKVFKEDSYINDEARVISILENF
jgi:hypothetical protein